MKGEVAMTIRIGTMEVSFQLDAPQTNGTSTMFETLVRVGSIPPVAHVHDAFEEIVYGLAGEMTFTVAGEERLLRAGDGLSVERGVPHRFENRAAVDGRFLSVATPGVFRPAYFEEMAAVFDAAGDGPIDIAAAMDVMRRH